MNKECNCNSWKDVHGELPKSDTGYFTKDVLVMYEDRRSTVALYDYGMGNWYTSHSSDMVVNVTHWMHIPDLPEEL